MALGVYPIPMISDEEIENLFLDDRSKTEKIISIVFLT